MFLKQGTMKKILGFGFGLLMGLPSISIAQKTVYFGAKAGLSIPSLQAGESKNIWNKDYKSRIGPSFGLFAEIPLNKNFSLVPELNFAGQGGKRNNIQPMSIPEEYVAAFQTAFNTTETYIFANLKNTSRINFLQIPLQLKYNRALTANGKLKAYAQFGPFVGFMLLGKQIVSSKELHVYLDEQGTKEIPATLVEAFFGTSVDTIIDAKKDLYHWNYGIQGSVGFSLEIGKGKLLLEGGGNYGFRYLQKGDEHGKNRIGAGTVVLGYAFPFNFGKKKEL